MEKKRTKEKTKEISYETISYTFYGGARPPNCPSSSAGSAPPITPPLSAARETNSPAFASRRKVSTAGVALSSLKSSPISENGREIAF